MSPLRQGPGSEEHADAAFTTWLQAQGWECTHARPGADAPDIDARHPELGRWIIEVKGDVSDNGASLDVGYGQILRRMDAPPGTRYALVVARKALKAALRVPEPVRKALGIQLYVVEPDGRVGRIEAS